MTEGDTIVEVKWTSERRGIARFRTEQPPYSILNRGIEREVLPICQKYGMGVLAWSPLAMGQLTGRYRRGQPPPDSGRAKYFPKQTSDERRLGAVEQLIPLAEQAGIPLTHLAMAFVIAHPGVTSAIIGPRTTEHLGDLLAGIEVVLDDAVLDQIDAIVPPGTDAGSLTWNSDPANEHRAMFGTYSASKTASHAVTLAFALESEGIKVSIACPGFTSTALNNFAGTRSVEQGAREAVRLALLGTDGPTGTFSDEDGPVAW